MWYSYTRDLLSAGRNVRHRVHPSLRVTIMGRERKATVIFYVKPEDAKVAATAAYYELGFFMLYFIALSLLSLSFLNWIVILRNGRRDKIAVPPADTSKRRLFALYNICRSVTKIYCWEEGKNHTAINAL